MANDGKLTSEELAAMRKKENERVLKQYRLKNGDTTARSTDTQPSIIVTNNSRGGKLLQFPTSTIPPTSVVSGDGEVQGSTEGELDKPK